MPTPLPPTPPLNIARYYYGHSSVKNNVLFLAEGYTSDMQDNFETLVWHIIDYFLDIPPFNLLYNRFNFFTAFTPSVEAGISAFDPITDDGTPVPYISSGPISNPGFLKEKPSALGLMYKFGDEYGMSAVPKTGDETLLERFIGTLQLSSSIEPAGGSGIPECWLKPDTASTNPARAKDLGLVVVIINDDIDVAHVLNEYAVVVCNSVLDKFENITAGPPGRYDHTPSAALLNSPPQLAMVVAHELAHSHWNLADEYEVAQEVDPNKYYGVDPDQSLIDYPNAVSLNRALDAGNNFDPTLIRWHDDLHPDAKAYMTGPPHQPFSQHVGPPSCFDLPPDTAREYPPVGVAPGSAHRERIIGFYEGAYYEPCGIYRPAGYCLMRHATHHRLPYGSGPSAISPFCYTCLRTIVEKTDISVKPELKKRYYPW